MARPGVEAFVYLLEQAFRGNRDHSLLANLRATQPDDWAWVPPDGARSIREMVQHVGSCKFVYHRHAFGDGSLTWDSPLVKGEDYLGSLADAIGWLEQGHQLLIDSVSALDDDELLRPRKASWGKLHETRWLISVMVEHDLYHAGEINHIRSLRSGHDQWR